MQGKVSKLPHATSNVMNAIISGGTIFPSINYSMNLSDCRLACLTNGVDCETMFLPTR